MKNIFIVGLEESQRQELATVRHVDQYAFHRLLDYNTVVRPRERSFHKILDLARRELDAFPGSVDAIVAQWDFPTSLMVPILCHERGLPSPSLESVLKCEHKYWSRLEQRQSIPEYVPEFAIFDPFDDAARDQIPLDFPFWIKPVKSFASQLGFMIRDMDAFRMAQARIRANIDRIAFAFDEVLAMADLPDEIARTRGSTCIAEEIMPGDQHAPEGSVFQGETQVHGVIEMPRDVPGNSFLSFEYPSSAPPDVQQRMVDASRRFLQHIGFDNGCFNVEFLWDKARDKLWLIEVNARISQSHSNLFAKVDGMSNHEIAVNVALGRAAALPHRQGAFRVAGKFMIPHYEDAVVRSIPSPADIERLCARFPGTRVAIDVKPGDRLAALPNQDSYRYVLGTLLLGADSREQLHRRFEACLDALPFELEPVAAQRAHS